MNIEPIDMSTGTADLFEASSGPTSCSHGHHYEYQNRQYGFSSTSCNSSSTKENNDSLLQSMQELYSLIASEISNRGITKNIFAKVVLNEPGETIDRLFQCKGVGYEYFVRMIRTFLGGIPPEERANRYRNVGRALVNRSENAKAVNLSREEILDVIQQAKAEMSRMSITQMVFAKVVLGRTAGVVSQMLKFNGVGYEKHIPTIRSFLARPVAERRMLYMKGVTPSPSDSQPSRLPLQSELHRTPVPTGLVQEIQVSENVTTVNQVTNYAVYSTEQTKSES